MIVGCFISVVLLRFLGEILDRVIAALMDAGVYEVTSTWQTDPSALINLFYIVCMLPAVISIIVGILRSQHRTQFDLGGPAQEEIQYDELR